MVFAFLQGMAPTGLHGDGLLRDANLFADREGQLHAHPCLHGCLAGRMFSMFLFQKKRTARKQSALYISNRRRRHFVLRKSYFVLDLELRSCNLAFIQRQVASGPKSYNLGPAATRALPASLPSYFLKFLMKRPARSSAFLFHSAASA